VSRNQISEQLFAVAKNWRLDN